MSRLMAFSIGWTLLCSAGVGVGGGLGVALWLNGAYISNTPHGISHLAPGGDAASHRETNLASECEEKINAALMHPFSSLDAPDISRICAANHVVAATRFASDSTSAWEACTASGGESPPAVTLAPSGAGASVTMPHRHHHDLHGAYRSSPETEFTARLAYSPTPHPCRLTGRCITGVRASGDGRFTAFDATVQPISEALEACRAKWSPSGGSAVHSGVALLMGGGGVQQAHPHHPVVAMASPHHTPHDSLIRAIHNHSGAGAGGASHLLHSGRLYLVEVCLLCPTTPGGGPAASPVGRLAPGGKPAEGFPWRLVAFRPLEEGEWGIGGVKDPERHPFVGAGVGWHALAPLVIGGVTLALCVTLFCFVVWVVVPLHSLCVVLEDVIALNMDSPALQGEGFRRQAAAAPPQPPALRGGVTQEVSLMYHKVRDLASALRESRQCATSAGQLQHHHTHRASPPPAPPASRKGGGVLSYLSGLKATCLHNRVGTVLLTQLRLEGPGVSPLTEVARLLEKVKRFGSTTPQLQGGRVMLTWGTPLQRSSHHAEAACRCALSLGDISVGPTVLASSTLWYGTAASRLVVFGNAILQAWALSDLVKLMKVSVMCTDRVHSCISSLPAFEMIPVDVVELPEESDVSATAVTNVYTLLHSKLPKRLRAMYHDAFRSMRWMFLDSARSNLIAFLREAGEAEADASRQAARLLRITMYLTQRGVSSATQQYQRNLPTWEDLEAKARRTPLAPEVAQLVSKFEPGVEQVTLQGEAIPKQQTLDVRSTIEVHDSHYVPMSFSDGVHRFTRSKVQLGRGAYATVWLGSDADGGLLAIKCLRLPEDPAKHAPILVEVDIMRRVSHPNIVPFVTSVPHGANVLLVMGYASGGSLAKMLRTFRQGHVGGLPLASVRRYGVDILRALVYLHDLDIVHGDVKPDNVLLNPDGDCQLADFGSAFKVGSSEAPGGCGTPAYAAPETCRRAPGKPSDVWSFGATLCQLTSGELPFRFGNSTNTQIVALMSLEDSVELPKFPSSLHGTWCLGVVQECLCYAQHLRPTAFSLLTSLYDNRSNTDSL